MRSRSRGRSRRLEWPTAVAAPRAVEVSTPPTLLPSTARILGLDPGSLVTGYAVIDFEGSKCTYVTSGSLRTAGGEFAARLEIIFSGISQLAQQWRPTEVAVERVFMHRNADSALKLGQARGAALCGAFVVQPKIFEYATREVKQAVVGTGAAQKDQVQIMVKHLLKLSGKLGPDAADALALALCHAHSRGLRALLQSQGAVRGLAK